jgi:hypothetical protein
MKRVFWIGYLLAAIALAVIYRKGALTAHVVETFGVVGHAYGGPDAAYLKDGIAYIDTKTLLWRQNGRSRDWQYAGGEVAQRRSYITVDLSAPSPHPNWVDSPLPAGISSAERLPIERKAFMNGSEVIEDFKGRSEPLLVYYGSILVRQSSSEPKSLYFQPSELSYRSPTAYPWFYIVRAVAWLCDFVTAPIQFLLYALSAYVFAPRWN